MHDSSTMHENVVLFTNKTCVALSLIDASKHRKHFTLNVAVVNHLLRWYDTNPMVSKADGATHTFKQKGLTTPDFFQSMMYFTSRFHAI